MTILSPVASQSFINGSFSSSTIQGVVINEQRLGCGLIDSRATNLRGDEGDEDDEDQVVDKGRIGGSGHGLGSGVLE
jgi:hypothetical protein